MMKSFFKKLAFVMALAMVVSMAAPAAKTVAAAEDKALAIAYQKGAVITALNLAEVGAKEDLRFVYAPENWKELGAVWSSSNPNVVSVDANGVVEAKAAGTATVSVAVGAETASIEVYSVDMKTFEVAIGTAEERALTEKTVKVGETVDFKFFGVKDYDVNYYNCVWGYAEVIGEDVVDFDADRGDIVAKNPGKVVVTLTVINKITRASIKVQNVEVTVESETPVVDNSFTVKQLNSDTVEVTFANKEIAASAVNFKASSKSVIFTNEDEFLQVGELKDGVVTVKFYNGLTVGTTYTLVNGEESVTFEASNGLVDKIVISYKCDNTDNVAYATRPVTLSAKVYSGDVEVTANNGVSFKYSSSLFGTESTGNTFYATQADEVIAVTATYYNTGSSTPVVATIAIPVRALPEYRMKTTDAKMEIQKLWEIDDTNSFMVKYIGNGTNKISTSDVADRYMVFATEDIRGNDVSGYAVDNTFRADMGYEGDTALQYGVFRFTTTNDNVLGVSESSGQLYPRSAGTAVIQVWFTNSATGNRTLVGSKQVTVYGPRVLTEYSLYETYSTNMSSSSAQLYATIADEAGFDNYDVVTFKFSCKDQLGDKIAAGSLDLDWDYLDKANDDGAVAVALATGDGYAGYTITADYDFTDDRVAYKDVELVLKADTCDADIKKQNVTVRIFNTDYDYKYTTNVAVLRSDSTWDLGVLRGKYGVRNLVAGVVEYENNAYNMPGTIVDKYAEIKPIIDAANAAKARLNNAQNVLTPAEAAAIASASALVDNGWYYKVTCDGVNVTNSTDLTQNATNLTFQVRKAASDLKSNYLTKIATGNYTGDILGDVWADTYDGDSYTFTFYKVKYDLNTSRFYYETKTVSRNLKNEDRDLIGGKAIVQKTTINDINVNTIEDVIKNYVHVEVYDACAWTGRTLCNDCYWTTNWKADRTTDGFSLTGIKTNGEGVYYNQYIDSQSVNQWAYVVSIYVTYTHTHKNAAGAVLGTETVTVEIPVNTRFEW